MASDFTLDQPFVADNGTTYTGLAGVFQARRWQSQEPIVTDEGNAVFQYRFGDLIRRSNLPLTPEGDLSLGNEQAIPLCWVIDFVELDKQAGRYGVSFLVRNHKGDKFIPNPIGETKILTDYDTGRPKLTQKGNRQFSLRLDRDITPQQGFTFRKGFEIVLTENPNPEANPRLSLRLITRKTEETYPAGPSGPEVREAKQAEPVRSVGGAIAVNADLTPAQAAQLAAAAQQPNQPLHEPTQVPTSPNQEGEDDIPF